MQKENRLIVSIYDYSGQWPAEYIKAGYPVLLWDYKCEGCILQHFDRLYGAILEAQENGYKPYGLMAAPPCTDISAAGAQFWPEKDKQPAPDPYGPHWTITDFATAMVEIVMHLKQLFTWNWWVIENPPGRMERLVPETCFYRSIMFNPCDYGDPYTKRTVLWGEFNSNLKKSPVKPDIVKATTNGRVYNTSAMMAKRGGKSDLTKELRSNTPTGFANAFFIANQ